MSQNASVEDRLAAALKDVASLEEKLREQLLLRRQSIDPHDEQVSKLNEQIAKQNTVIHSLQKELENATSEFDRLVESSKEMEALLEAELVEARRVISNLQIRIEQLVKQNQSIQTSSQQIPELQALNAKTEAKLEAATKRVQSLETQNDALETKARKFETQYEKMVSLYNETLQKCALNEAEIEELKEFKQRAKVELEERSAAVAAPPPSDWSPKFMYVGFVLLIGFIGYQKLKRSST